MTVERTVEALKQYCTANSGDTLGQTWQGKNGTYHWNLGKTTSDGTMNGVVRKLAGIEASGRQIWIVAGSLKIAASGEILRFTGLAKKQQKSIQQVITPILMPDTVVA
jgi:hypothetical protein